MESRGVSSHCRLQGGLKDAANLPFVFWTDVESAFGRLEPVGVSGQRYVTVEPEPEEENAAPSAPKPTGKRTPQQSKQADTDCGQAQSTPAYATLLPFCSEGVVIRP